MAKMRTRPSRTGRASPGTAYPVRSATRALLIGEESSRQRRVGLRLRQAGFAVTTAEAGLDAVWLAHQDAPDLIVFDDAAPGAEMRFALFQLRHDPHTAHVPILLEAQSATNTLADFCHSQGGMLVPTRVRRASTDLRSRHCVDPTARRRRMAVEPPSSETEVL